MASLYKSKKDILNRLFKEDTRANSEAIYEIENWSSFNSVRFSPKNLSEKLIWIAEKQKKIGNIKLFKDLYSIAIEIL